MSYRINEPKPPAPRRTMEKMTTPSDLFITLGTTVNLAIPCWYIETRKPRPAKPHCRTWHDHIGWPSPTHPDHICQAYDFADSCEHHGMKGHPSRHVFNRGYCDQLIDARKLIPVHLLKEGYTKAEVKIEYMEGDDRVKLTGSAVIDSTDDWIVRINLDSMPNASERGKPFKKAFFRVSVFASGDNILTEKHPVKNKRDLVCQVKVCVNPTAVVEE